MLDGDATAGYIIESGDDLGGRDAGGGNCGDNDDVRANGGSIVLVGLGEAGRATQAK